MRLIFVVSAFAGLEEHPSHRAQELEKALSIRNARESRLREELAVKRHTAMLVEHRVSELEARVVLELSGVNFLPPVKVHRAQTCLDQDKLGRHRARFGRYRACFARCHSPNSADIGP